MNFAGFARASRQAMRAEKKTSGRGGLDMLSFMRILIAFAIAGGLSILGQPPAVRQNGIFNTASRIPLALSGGSIARDSRFTIQGVRLGGALETRVLLKHGEKSIVLPVLSANPREIEAWMPEVAPLGSTSVSVETSAGPSKEFPIAVVKTQPGLFSANGLGWGPGKIDNLSARGKRVPNGLGSPARPGQMIQLWATGLSEAGKVDIVIGGRTAAAMSVRRDEQRGVESVLVRIPEDAPRGCYVPAYTRVSSTDSSNRSTRSNMVTIAISEQSRCELTAGTRVDAGQTIGVVGVSRTMAVLASNQPATTIDEGFAAFSVRAQTPESNRLLLLPPAGTCTTFTGLYHDDFGEFASVPAALADPGNARTLDAGPAISISGGPMGTRSLPLSGSRPGVYWTQLGFEEPGSARNLTLFLNGSPVNGSTPGGKDVSAISAALPVMPAFQWMNREMLATVHRERGLDFEWRGAPPQTLMLILAASFDPLSTAGEICYCAARADAGRMRVPPEALVYFPATGAAPGPFRSGVALIAIQIRDTQKPVSGLDWLRLVSVFVQAQRVVYE